MSKTVRFTNVVEIAGKPFPYTLWTSPERDAIFQRALKAHRILTVHHENVGNARDYGTVGYQADEHAMLFVFPKSLKKFEGKRVVGIKYELIES